MEIFKGARSTFFPASVALVLVGCLHVVAVDQAVIDASGLTAGRDFVLVVEPGAGGEDVPIELLRTQAFDGLVAKGYRPSSEGDLAVTLAAGEERVRARTMTADPGYNSYALRERKEAVVSLFIVRTGRAEPLWRGSARVVLPRSGLLVGPDPEAAWQRALAEVVDRLPDRKAEWGDQAR